MKQDDYRNMCDEIKLSEEQKDKIWVAARAKVQTKKENSGSDYCIFYGDSYARHYKK